RLQQRRRQFAGGAQLLRYAAAQAGLDGGGLNVADGLLEQRCRALEVFLQVLTDLVLDLGGGTVRREQDDAEELEDVVDLAGGRETLGDGPQALAGRRVGLGGDEDVVGGDQRGKLEDVGAGRD